MISQKMTKNIIKYSLIASISIFALFTTIFVQAEEDKEKEIFPAVAYKKPTNNKGYVISIDDKQAVWLVEGAGKYNLELRAQKIAEELDNFVKSKNNPEDIKPYKQNKYVVVKAGEKTLFTADKLNAKAFGVSEHELAYTWANDTRKALGANTLTSDYSQVPKNNYDENFKNKYLGKKITGFASWYGTFFHGQTSSDGSRYNKYEFTAAHKSLPFGTLVKVKNLRNQKTCVVKITDRGPYVGPRIIDLSRRTAQELDMLAKGVQKVELEIIGKY